jgi:DNA-binding transcriptional LysR family regulator
MHLRNVELFCEIAQRRSFSKAAEAQSVSQPAASQAVHALEERLGTQLIDRSVRPLGLTPAGKVYFEGCRRLLDEFRLVEDDVRRMSDVVVGRVRVAAIYSVGLLQMDAYVRRFHELYPQAELRLAYLHPDEVYERILNDEADLGLVSFPKDGGDVSCIPWQDQPMVAVVPPDHRLANHTAISLSELAGEPFVAFTPELTIRRKIDRWLKQAGIAVDIVHAFDNIENIKRAVEVGSGLAILPEPTVSREVELGSLHIVKPADASWCRPLGIIHRRNKSLTSVAERFVELLHEDPATFTSNGRERNSGNHRQNGSAQPTSGADSVAASPKSKRKAATAR